MIGIRSYQKNDPKNRPVFRIFFNKLDFKTIIVPVYRSHIPSEYLPYGAFSRENKEGMFLHVPGRLSTITEVNLCTRGKLVRVSAEELRTLMLKYE